MQKETALRGSGVKEGSAPCQAFRVKVRGNLLHHQEGQGQPSQAQVGESPVGGWGGAPVVLAPAGGRLQTRDGWESWRGGSQNPGESIKKRSELTRMDQLEPTSLPANLTNLWTHSLNPW